MIATGWMIGTATHAASTLDDRPDLVRVMCDVERGGSDTSAYAKKTWGTGRKKKIESFLHGSRYKLLLC